MSLTLNLLGNHQVENAKTALAAIEVVKQSFEISDTNIKNGFLNTTNPARFELLSRAPYIILDGAHNPDGISALRDALKKYFDNKNAVLILGILSDKDGKNSVRILKGLFDAVYTVPVNNPRTLSAEDLALECEEYFDDVKVFDNVFDAFDKAYELCRSGDKALVIAGSLYLAGEIRPYIISKTK